jgi:glutamate formiminotransferase
VLECVINVSEGRDLTLLHQLGERAGRCLLDVHRDGEHHRSVFTLAGPDEELDAAVRDLAAAVVDHVDLRTHEGAHPRLGALDVVPWVDLASQSVGPRAMTARDRFAAWAGDKLQLPCFLYGPERSLPDVRRHAWADLRPDTGPDQPHPTAGAAAVGARTILVAYNLWLEGADLATARTIAADLRGPQIRALGLALGRSGIQVSCNLIAPAQVDPAAAFDAVASQAARAGAAVARAELVGLIPAALLDAVPRHRWAELDLDPSRTIEARLEQAGLDGGRSGEH